MPCHASGGDFGLCDAAGVCAPAGVCAESDGNTTKFSWELLPGVVDAVLAGKETALVDIAGASNWPAATSAPPHACPSALHNHAWHAALQSRHRATTIG